MSCDELQRARLTYSKSLRKSPNLLLFALWLSPLTFAVFFFSISTQYNSPPPQAIPSTSERDATRFGLAIVIPFVAHQMSQLEENLGRWSFSNSTPCAISTQGVYFSHLSEVDVDLIFYFNQDLMKTMGIVSRIKQLLGQPQRAPDVANVASKLDDVHSVVEKNEGRIVGDCFHKIKFWSARLAPEDDIYPLGASNMFFRLFSQSKLTTAYDAMFYMEPDNLPCRPYWIHKVVSESELGRKHVHAAERSVADTGHPSPEPNAERHISNKYAEGFWVKGSIIRNNMSSPSLASFSDHLNGNALYRWDSEGHNRPFLSFVSHVAQHFHRHPHLFLNSYDIAMFLVRRNRTLTEWKEYTSTMHKFVYVSWIQNVYREKVNGTKLAEDHPNTFFVHGREVYW
jgi:hypothetical protein